MLNKKYIMFIAVIFWAGTFIAGKYTANIINPITITFLRFLIASTILNVYLITRRKRVDININLLKESTILAIIGMIIYHFFFYTALKYTTATNASLIAATNPFFTYILAIIFLKTKVERTKFIYIIIAFVGVATIIINWDFSSISNGAVNKGDLYMVSAVFLWASYSILVRKYIIKYDPIVLTASVFNIAFLLLIPFANYSQVSKLFQYDLNVILSIFYMGIFPTVFGYLIQQFSIKEIGPERTNMFVNLVPVITIVLAVVILHESLNFMNIFSAIVVIGAVYKFNTVQANRV